MSAEPAEAQPADPAPAEAGLAAAGPAEPPWRGRAVWLSAIGAGLVGAWHFASFDIWEQPLITDVRFFVYFADRIVDGAVPYRDLQDVKTPLSFFAGAGFMRLGDALGVDRLTAVRVGYLSLAWTAGMLLYETFRRLSGGRLVAGWLALVAYLGFDLIGLLPSIGNVPKLIMALGAAAAALAIAHDRWRLAGCFAALAFLDWQVGALTGLAVAAAALTRDDRAGALRRSAEGALLCLLVPAGYFLAHGALDDAFRESISATFTRGAAKARGLSGTVDHLDAVFWRGTEGRTWTVFVGLAGIALLPLLWRRARGEGLTPMLTMLAVYHLGVVAFSFQDFQGNGDLFLLLFSVSFFMGVALSVVWLAVEPHLGRAALAGGVAAVVLVTVAVQPAPLGEDLRLGSAIATRRATLADQREVSQAVCPRLEGNRLAFFEHSEQLHLCRARNVIRPVTWAPGGYFPPWVDLLRESCPDVVALRHRHQDAAELPDFFQARRFGSSSGDYRVDLLFVRDDARERYHSEFCHAGTP